MMIKSIRYKALSLLAVLGMACAGCHSDAPCPPGVDEPDTPVPDPDKLTLCLNVSFGDGVGTTRAENEPDRYDPPTGVFEKISTLRVIIVRDLSDNKTSGIIEANRLVMTNDEGRPIYDNLEFKVIANEQKRIFLIANEDYLEAPIGFEVPQGYNPARYFLDSFKAKDSSDGETMTTDLSALTNWTVSVPGFTESMTEIKGYSKGLFSPTSSRRLPLTEFFDIETKRDPNDPDDTFYSHLFMTRAAAKAMFYLNTRNNFTGDIRNTYITAIALEGVGSTEYVFPHNAVYSPSKETLISVSATDKNDVLKNNYISNFTTPSGNKKLTYLIDEDVNAEIKYYGETARAITDSPIYFPESVLAPGEHYIVHVCLSNGTWLTAPLQPQKNADDEQINKYNILNITDKDGVTREAIARNTFLPIELYFDEALNLEARVLPWDREDYYVEYTNNVGITNEGCLNFEGTEGQTGDYFLLDEEAAQLVLNYGKVAKGSFTIASPLGYTWDAYLITTGGTQDAIQFQIPDPDDNTKTITTTHISGEIGKKAEFGIVSTVAPGSEQNSAQLIVMATLATGTQVIVDVLKSWPSGNPGILTVIQDQI